MLWTIFGLHSSFIGGLLTFGVFFYFLWGLISRKPEIILTREGIEFRNKGYYVWDFVDSVETASGDSSVDLIVHFNGFAGVKFDIGSLEKNSREIVDLILEYKHSANSVKNQIEQNQAT